MQVRARALAVLAAIIAALARATAAGAQKQSGLVTVAIVNNAVQIPIGIAANVCGVAVDVLAQNIATGEATCTALGDATATRAGGNGGGGGGNQQGLVNLFVADNTVQVPVGIAANICGVAANVLAQGVA